MKTTAQVELINFQDPTHNNDFETYYFRTVFDLPEKVVGVNI